MKLTRATSLLLTGLLASGCASTTSEPTNTLLQNPISINAQAYWQLGLTNTDFDALVTNLHAGADINETLYALRGFSYFGNTKNLTAEQLNELDAALFARMQNIAIDDYRTIENYAVTLYRYYYFDDLKDKLAKHLPLLPNVTLNSSSPLAAQYAKWEQLRAIGFLAFEARGQDKIKQAVLAQTDWQQELLDLLKNDNSWQQAHAAWALGYLHYILDDEAAEKALDEKVLAALEQNPNTNKEFIFSQRYLVNSFRGKSACEEEFEGRCSEITLDDALPINHNCSDSLFIRAQTLTTEQLNISCERLISQESHFHDVYATNRQPVPNDFNEALRVVIFDNYTGYNQHGQMIFDISTDNGGMYIEGKPSKPGNQATFYSFKAFWKEDFSVWNLNHEYVHYLDGRFNKYDGFGHFPSHLVWWSEGGAELIAQGNSNDRVNKLLHETEQAKWPTLREIFDTTYQDGSKHVYQWSYLAHRYLSENALDDYRQLAHFLRTDYFEGYSELLDSLVAKHDNKFANYLATYKQANPYQEAAVKAKPNKLYRYLYRDYLMPKALKINAQHNHIL